MDYSNYNLYVGSTLTLGLNLFLLQTLNFLVLSTSELEAKGVSMEFASVFSLRLFSRVCTRLRTHP